MAVPSLSKAASLFCEGPLLHAVQTLQVFPDSKTFVDMPAKQDPEVILALFAQLPQGDQSDRHAVEAFVHAHFGPAGSDLEPVTPHDFTPDPTFLSSISNAEIRAWAAALYGLWPSLTRRATAAVAAHPQRHSLLPRRHTMVVPGGRFRESFYWDSYWIVRGLLVCGLVHTAAGVVANLLEDVSAYGLVPNGGRVYFAARSQPPLLSDMVADVAAAQDTDANTTAYLTSALPALEAEYAFWVRDRSVTVAGHVLSRYWCSSAQARPRPESYREDLETAGGDAPLLAELTAAAESGWDFSSRWWLRGVEDDGAAAAAAGARAGLVDTRVRRIVPVDLNTMLYRYERNLASFCKALGRASDATRYHAAAAARAAAMRKVMWDASAGLWRDLVLPEAAGNAARPGNVTDFKLSAHITPACFVPLWAGEALTGLGEAPAAVEALLSSGLLGPGGVMTSRVASGEQWDRPVSWPPLQWLVVEGLRTAGSSCAGAVPLADRLALEWLEAARAAWRRTGFMHEKLDGLNHGDAGKGGEYEPQVGFGWTNGVALDWIWHYYGGGHATGTQDGDGPQLCVHSVGGGVH